MERKCSKCGTLVGNEARFCNICGAALDSSSATTARPGSAAISNADADVIISYVREAYASIPLIARSLVPPMPQILSAIPACARKYTLQQIIDLLEEAHARRLI